MEYKLALVAGHYYNEPGKRCLKSIDPAETREWWLNDRIADKVEKLLADYDGIEILRLDDTTGKNYISLTERSNAANTWNADFYLSIHHNAGIKGGSGGGIVAYVHPDASNTARHWQKDLYNALIAATGLKGNRSNPLAEANLHECRETAMPAVLLELGFMDSTHDTPIILTEDYADKCAEAIVKVIADTWNLSLKTSITVTVTEPASHPLAPVIADANVPDSDTEATSDGEIMGTLDDATLVTVSNALQQIDYTEAAMAQVKTALIALLPSS